MAGTESEVLVADPTATARPLSPELAELLRTGPFEDALRVAIRFSRLSLERIQHRLRMRGTPVSITALSYWQSGRRRPERPDSLRALRQLEDVLGLPDSALSALLGPPRPRGRMRRAATEAPPLSALWSSHDSVDELLKRVDTSPDGKLSRLNLHDVVHVDAQGIQRKLRVRQLARAECNGADRWTVMFDGAASSEAPAVIRPVRSCRLGQVFTDPKQDVVAAELLFDHELERGETILMEYEILNMPSGTYEDDYSYSRLFRLPVQQYVLEVRFDPASAPTRCESFINSTRQEPKETRSLSLDRDGRTHAVALDFGMGVFGVRWEPAPPPVVHGSVLSLR
jgi:transcriptional regulator with XRE-family HTH domain